MSVHRRRQLPRPRRTGSGGGAGVVVFSPTERSRRGSIPPICLRRHVSEHCCTLPPRRGGGLYLVDSVERYVLTTAIRPGRWYGRDR